eukprot:CAMPEP_0118701950 /NCGR_PEP_ID=MMETSP0800-20121206/17578_1 /TAXON_ID=210618 ORGANISM="Striatella unipunctata, Strain CCMP2910" /NCGR_SAMPLE_ID=MMETSP0800 /ASSEMBLY_ACC=CAM_ASM_000638 /LENGTH=99 /DNA_ID=CAMNT_0006603013 /DNA_START=168 /DNA_END=467 /DNA_ORIENTATION=-
MSIVFGWPDNYVASLTSNLPVGLTSLALGAFTTSTLDTLKFDFHVNSYLGYIVEKIEDAEEEGGFWVSIAVMAITGVFSYVALNLVNKKEDADEKKKEL